VDATGRLRMEPTQRLLMTPELRQALEMLELPVLDLVERVERELSENPALELLEATGDDTSDEGEFDEAWIDYFSDSSDLGYVSERVEPSVESAPASAPGLREHVLGQLGELDVSEGDIRIAREIVDLLDENGYIKGPLPGADGAGEEAVERVLEVLRGLEPAGIFARDLRECLLLQLRSLEGGEGVIELARAIVERHLQDLARGRYEHIARSERVGIADISAAAAVVRSLDPTPGRRYSAGPAVPYVLPDLTVREVEGDYIVLVNDGDIPPLCISPLFRRLLRDGGTSSEVGRFVRDRLRRAAWFLRSIDQRRSTLRRLGEALVACQRRFFEEGPRGLCPLTLAEVAERMGVHESTVSRAVKDKYVQTPHGIMPLRAFFASGVSGPAGDSSAESVKRMIVEIVKGEDHAAPYTDSQIASMLRARGIGISRRTVSKYRNDAGILSSRERRRV